MKEKKTTANEKRSIFIDICKCMDKEVPGPQKIQKEDYSRKLQKEINYQGAGFS